MPARPERIRVDRLFEWFKKHPAAGQDARAALERFERFVCAQQFWDRAMAEAIASVNLLRLDPVCRIARSIRYLIQLPLLFGKPSG
jgi:hypothetical protein